ncbi:hypothetical protein LAJ19_03475 [Deinococcus taeanensis]|uniref:hypothetical protein n=1 Tax=Deinococcus taeanensis TaxID=2737050 RepID=UPI001CDC5268|nr:hypothetical protein [Deinococcus taeanensis]UBV43288.1 hypothetical protein LAJ19_03475 [Deinococcus taeanensis]
MVDTADLGAFSRQRAEIAVHEVAHPLGVGPLWSRFRLVSGGSGTVGAQWRVTTCNPELMTGHLNSGVRSRLSRSSGSSLQDTGYTVCFGTAAACTVPAATTQAPKGLHLGAAR